MGLKYEYFLVKIPYEELASKLKTDAWIIDDTDQYLKMLKDEIDRSNLLEELMQKEGTKTMEDIHKAMDIPSDILEYRKKLYDQTQMSLHQVPNHPDWTYGFYMSVPPFGNELSQMAATLEYIYTSCLMPYVPEVFFANYHDGCGDGDIGKQRIMDGKLDFTAFNHKEGEMEQFKKYSRRVQKETNAPFYDLHKLFNGETAHTPMQSYHFIVDIEKWNDTHKPKNVEEVKN